MNVYIIGAYIIWNIIVFLLYGVDKLKAKAGAWRIPEKTLLGVSSGVLLLAAAYCLRGRTAAVVSLAGRYVPVIVMFICVLFISLQLRCAFLERSKVLSYLSKLTYPFYLMHMLAWKLSDVLFAPQTPRMRIVSFPAPRMSAPH